MISAHFSDSELTAGMPAGTVVPPDVRERAVRLAVLLEAVRAALGVPLKVDSWYRSAAHNEEVGGVSNSQHLTGAAADVVALLLPLGDALDRFRAAQARGDLPPFGQAIFYPVKGHIHLSTRDGTAAEDSVLLAVPSGGTTVYTKATLEAAANLPRIGTAALPLLVVLVVLGLVLLALRAARP